MWSNLSLARCWTNQFRWIKYWHELLFQVNILRQFSEPANSNPDRIYSFYFYYSSQWKSRQDNPSTWKFHSNSVNIKCFNKNQNKSKFSNNNNMFLFTTPLIELQRWKLIKLTGERSVYIWQWRIRDETCRGQMNFLVSGTFSPARNHWSFPSATLKPESLQIKIHFGEVLISER